MGNNFNPKSKLLTQDRPTILHTKQSEKSFRLFFYIVFWEKDGRSVASYERKKDLEEWQKELSKKEWFIKLQEEERKKENDGSL